MGSQCSPVPVLGKPPFSCLADADFLATEAFMQPEESARRPKWPTDIFVRMETILDEHYISHFQTSTNEVESAQPTSAPPVMERHPYHPASGLKPGSNQAFLHVPWVLS